MKILSEYYNSNLNTVFKLGIPETNDEWDAYYNLRYEILRKPWNQPASSVRVDDDATALHYCLIHDYEMIGICRLHFNTETEAQIRFFGITEQWRNHRLGDIMLKHAEDICTQNNISKIFLQARENAVPFYERNGYKLIEKTHLLFNLIQHYAMSKVLVG
ncbi:MAG: GNAT family N-acetyltransferase [Bacteroidetes bacterium]|jgi:N-acetylglutamate synthase-like GNAT family acetyltransferase|nr:GNAT family N-acetyltransferase [Bacteroidota bacterium]